MLRVHAMSECGASPFNRGFCVPALLCQEFLVTPTLIGISTLILDPGPLIDSTGDRGHFHHSSVPLFTLLMVTLFLPLYALLTAVLVEGLNNSQRLERQTYRDPFARQSIPQQLAILSRDWLWRKFPLSPGSGLALKLFKKGSNRWMDAHKAAEIEEQLKLQIAWEELEVDMELAQMKNEAYVPQPLGSHALIPRHASKAKERRQSKHVIWHRKEFVKDVRAATMKRVQTMRAQQSEVIPIPHLGPTLALTQFLAVALTVTYPYPIPNPDLNPNLTIVLTPPQPQALTLPYS